MRFQAIRNCIAESLCYRARAPPGLVMSLSVADLPLLLAGPILRRVETDLVSVWIATSRACNVSLLLDDDGDIVGAFNPADDPRAKWVSAPQPTLRVGANLHVLTVVLDLRNPGGNATQEEVPPRVRKSYAAGSPRVQSTGRCISGLAAARRRAGPTSLRPSASTSSTGNKDLPLFLNRNTAV